jgi:formamidopyrimidine-DNA glycosylase
VFAVPELPEVESVRRQLAPRLKGRRIAAIRAVPQARFFGLERAVGGHVEQLDRRGKYLIAHLDNDLDLVMHLGMTGSFRFYLNVQDQGLSAGWSAGVIPGIDGTPDAYVRATFFLDEAAVLYFRDVRRFGRLCVVDAGDYTSIATLAALGPEPLSDDFDPERFHADLAATRMAVKPFLLTQRPVAGVGNIYADEALWRARINPRARRIGRVRAHALWAAIRAVLAEAIEREGTTFRDYQMVNGESGHYADFLVAYGQAGKPCPRCGVVLAKTVLGGRGTTYCPSCQRR